MSRVRPERFTLASYRGRFDKEVWLRRLLNLAVALAVGYVLGHQILDPQPRVLKGVIGAAVLYAAWKFPISVSISAFLLLFPYPFGTTYASSNTIFIFLITAMWLAQIVLRTEKPVGRTMLDLPILVLMGAYVLSFSGVSHAEAVAEGLINLSTIVAGVFAYYLIVHTIRDETTLRRTMTIIMVMVVSTFVIALYELFFPGHAFIKGWILSQSNYDPRVLKSGVRVGGPFGDFELYAEFCAMTFPLMLFHFVRAVGSRGKALWGALTLLNLVVLLATVTRGGTISLFVGLVYLLVLVRKRLDFKKITLLVTASALILVGLEFVISNYTVSGSIFERLASTKIVNGLPEDRSFWPQIIERIKERPWVGHGPYYEFGEYGKEKLVRYVWPHNGYLYYLHTVGLLGTSAFVWILFTLWSRSKRLSSGMLDGSDYVRSLLLAWNVTLVIFMVDQMKIEYLRNHSYEFWPWIVFGMIVTTLNVIRAQSPTPAVSRADRVRQLFRRGVKPPMNVENDPATSPG